MDSALILCPLCLRLLLLNISGWVSDLSILVDCNVFVCQALEVIESIYSLFSMHLLLSNQRDIASMSSTDISIQSLVIM